MKKNNIIIAVLVIFVLVQTTTKIASASTTYTANELLTKIVQAENSLKWTVKNSFNKAVLITKNLNVKGNTTLGDSTADTITVHGTVTLDVPLSASNISSTGIVKSVTAGSGISIADSGNGSNQISSSLGTSITSDEITDGTIAAADLANTAAVKGITAGSNVTVTNNNDGTFTIASTDTTGSTYTAGTGITITSSAIASTLGTSISNGELDADAVTSAKIADGSIVNADVSNSAGIALSKLESGTAGQLIVANGSGVPSYVTMSGDATISSSGALSLNVSSVTESALGSSVVTSSKIADGTITTTDISGTAAITDSQVNDNLTISGGLVDNTPIGATTAATGNFTGVKVNGEARTLAALNQLPHTNTLTAVDSTGNVGDFPSSTIGTDGFPVISYHDTTNGGLKVVKCGNAACSSGNTTTVVDVSAASGQYTSIIIGTDGFPVISYSYVVNGILKVAKCGNAACSSGNTITAVDSTGDVGQYTSIVIGTDGFPVVGYYDVASGNLKVAKCGNAACSSGNTLTLVDSTGDVGSYVAITINRDGFPVISYYDATNSDFRVTKCSNAACSSSSLLSLDSAGDVGQYTSITIGADGLPVVSYYDATNGDLKVAHCSVTSCSSSTLASIDTASNVGQYTSISIGTDGFPVISYYDVTNADLKVVKCGSIDCSGANNNTFVTLDSGGNVGQYSSITIGEDGLPVVGYYDVTNGNLKVAKAANQYFLDNWARR